MSSSADPGAARALAQRAFDEWPPALRALLDGASLASKVGFTASLITCDALGRLRTSLLGIGELYAPSARCLAFALWPTSRAARTLSSHASSSPEHPAPPIEPHGDHRRARAALTFVHDGAFYQVQLTIEPLVHARGDAGAGSALAHFMASIDAGEVQQVDYARLTGGIAFELADDPSARKAVLERWEGQVEALRQAADAWLAAGSETGEPSR